jgi:poly-gamma-glutamate synthesis protein (capsule biosynthesis protein)
MVAQQDPAQPRTYEGITVRFDLREGTDGRFRVTGAAYVPTYWNNLATGPIRIQRVVRALAAGTGDRARLLAARAAIRAAVDVLGHNHGLRER